MRLEELECLFVRECFHSLVKGSFAACDCWLLFRCLAEPTSFPFAFPDPRTRSPFGEAGTANYSGLVSEKCDENDGTSAAPVNIGGLTRPLAVSAANVPAVAS